MRGDPFMRWGGVSWGTLEVSENDKFLKNYSLAAVQILGLVAV